MQVLLIFIAIAAGLANPFQSAANTQLHRSLGLPVWTAIFVYASGLLGLLLVQMFVREPLPAFADVANVPWWNWLGGLASIIATVSGITLAHKLGSALFTSASLTAALLLSVLLDHKGWLGFERHPASPLRLTGASLLIVGLWLIAKF